MKKIILFSISLLSLQSFAASDVFKNLNCATDLSADYYTANIVSGKTKEKYNLVLTYFFYNYSSPRSYTVSRTSSGFQGPGISVYDISQRQNGSLDLKIQVKGKAPLEMNCSQ